VALAALIYDQNRYAFSQIGISIAYYLVRCMMKKIVLLCFIILCTVFSCSRLDLAVNLANSYITNKTDDFFDLSGEQRKWFKKSIAKDIDKVKKTIFPQLATEMLQISQTINNQKSFDTATVLNSYDRLVNLFYDGLRIFTSTAVGLADKLALEQMVYFQKEADKKFSEMKEDPNKKSYTKIKKHFDSWAGGMNSEQKKELKVFVDKNPPPINEAVYSRQNLVHEFLRSYPDKLARKKFVEKFFTNYDSMLDSNYKKVLAEKHNRVAAFVTNLLNKMPEDQRQTLVETIRDRANQLLKISKG
jgi:hypothetical protein